MEFHEAVRIGQLYQLLEDSWRSATSALDLDAHESAPGASPSFDRLMAFEERLERLLDAQARDDLAPEEELLCLESDLRAFQQTLERQGYPPREGAA